MATQMERETATQPLTATGTTTLNQEDKKLGDSRFIARAIANLDTLRALPYTDAPRLVHVLFERLRDNPKEWTITRSENGVEKFRAIWYNMATPFSEMKKFIVAELKMADGSEKHLKIPISVLEEEYDRARSKPDSRNPLATPALVS